MDTIFAVSSGRPPAAIAVVRVSGAAASAAGLALAGALPTPRRASMRALRAVDGVLLDHALLLWFPGPATATGEDLLELHLHGGRAVVDAVEQSLGALPGLRAAEPGEFTRRALTNGRIDLAQAQGLADLLEAETEDQRRAAISAADGVLSRSVHGWLDTLSGIAAQVEATLDFSDEDDVATPDLSSLDTATRAWIAEVAALLDQPSVERLREGARIVLAGPPNAGKSSLFNALLDREAAIVTPIAGTTRDLIEATVVRGGQVYTLVDTAGLADYTDDPVERIGIDRAHRATLSADLILWLDDQPPPDRPALALHARADVPGRETVSADRQPVSIAHPASVAALWEAIAAKVGTIYIAPGAMILARSQRDAIETALTALRLDGFADDLLIRAEGLRRASHALAQLLGTNATEAMLDALFGRFCIGK
ncbi:tRNA uridine-5-carboxymethylaminomethyl(34) synthesis GTPase MnmE [Sphingomonas sp. SUN019]|uniref:tRNA uridine-5-carboxymethylaminomethyl(34) synthesis GTPase MnmE n=1 Tax=Sphingomonas sp. SUN019 TaxID=2937788 RepID=UPI0021642D3C|nr:tRNA uridine-5-carboxymethylaminomethyl(34) synthesis GTPase MnmE [Sphingomonas sp. SUN019]UVO50983.1 tRNA uridine-5-carboxymethylaminomethyl(34) synthesis GTPase MnmE [Sphingomonas sp. SUN019]